MTSILGLEEGYLKMRHGINTAREINHKPKLWKETYNYIYENRKIIKQLVKYND